MKCSPGDWIYDDLSHDIVGPDGTIAHLNGCVIDPAETKANGYLLAAAKELYAAAKAALEDGYTGDPFRSAIAKAEGRN